MKRSAILSKIAKLVELYESGEIPRPEVHEVYPDLDKSSRDNYLYFTLTVPLNYQRSSPAMWQSALATFNDPETNYLFYPEKVVEAEYVQFQNDLAKHKLSLQINNHSKIWWGISQTLFNEYESDPRKLLASGGHAVKQIKDKLISEKKSFPYLNGPKMSNYWLFILSEFTDVELSGKEDISIIPDTHVIKASAVLGVIDSADPMEIERAWKELLSGSDFIPMQIHPVLWHWSRNGFKPVV
ncbi:MAG: hypothetical protein QY318_03495 [Candidatus Dojkabacteria bacterium]|nr:MAG: hypothetical protein QY318_03495 [Candidatus Dojkabacteria bacterium]